MASQELPLHAATLLLLLIALIAWKTWTYHAFKRKSRGFPLPPGPKGEPILGHLRIIPASNPEYYYQQLSRELGSDILSFNVLGQSVIVLNSVEAAVDVLDKRGANYCDRPRFVLFEQMGWRGTLTVRYPKSKEADGNPGADEYNSSYHGVRDSEYTERFSRNHFRKAISPNTALYKNGKHEF